MIKIPILLCLFFVTVTLVSPLTGLVKSQEVFEIVPPLPSDRFTPSGVLPIINNSSSNTTKYLFTATYSPPTDCFPPWSYVVHLHAECSNDMSDYISGLWLGGVELLRTSTPKLSTNTSRNFWDVRKDITRYSFLLNQTNLNLTMMIQNIVKDVFTGVYNVSVSFSFYKQNSFPVALDSKDLNPKPTLPVLVEAVTGYSANVLEGAKSFYNPPADLIIPISDNGDNGFWFRIQNEIDLPTKQIQVPRNTFRAVLELYVSFHGNEEFWFLDPPSSYLRMNNLSLQGNGPYREVFITIDGECVGSELPFPVILTGGINPLFWKPIVPIGAFDLPSYDFELTPFLEKILDGKAHEFGIGIVNGLPYWLVAANLHLWLDKSSSNVPAGTVISHKPSFSFRSQEEFEKLDGSFLLKGKGRSESEGWVISSFSGNLTTLILQDFKFSSCIQFENNRTYQHFKLKIKVHKELKVLNHNNELLNRIVIKRKYPLNVIITSTSDRKIVMNVSHGFEESCSNGGNFLSYIDNFQISNGWLPESQLHQPDLAGGGSTEQKLSYRDGFICYSRNVGVTNGIIFKDDLSYGCSS